MNSVLGEGADAADDDAAAALVIDAAAAAAAAVAAAAGCGFAATEPPAVADPDAAAAVAAAVKGPLLRKLHRSDSGRLNAFIKLRDKGEVRKEFIWLQLAYSAVRTAGSLSIAERIFSALIY